MGSVPPPSKPYGRFSRIRLSRWWSYLGEDWTSRVWAAPRLCSPCSSKKAFPSSHSTMECLQHAVCPDTTICPLHDGRGLSGGYSPKGHCHRCVVSFSLPGHSTSTFLRPFAPPAFTGFIATMDALHPAWRALRLRMNTHLNPRRFTCLSRLTFRPFHLQPPHRHFPIIALTRYLSEIGRRVESPGRPIRSGILPVTRSRVRLSTAGSPTGSAESSSSLSYGLVVHFRLLSTPSREDAVTFRYGFVTKNPARTSTSLIKRLHRRTMPPLRGSELMLRPP